MKSLLKSYFLENIVKNQDRDAIEVGGEVLSYGSFNEVVESIRIVFQQQNIQHKAIIVLNDQSLHSYAGILAIHFSNNVFVPVEPSWPAQRFLDLLEIVKPAGIVISSNSQETIALFQKVPALKNLLIITAANGELAKPSVSVPLPANYEGIAYIIFTSGSTGIPKGVPVSLQNLNAFIDNIKREYSFSSNDRFLQVYDITFDVTYFSFFIPFCYGACCCILNHQGTTPKYLSIINDLIKRKITVVSMVPTVINLAKRYIKKEKALSVTYSFFIGDVLHHSDATDWQQFTPNGEIHNHYGPTEATIACSKYKWHKDKSKAEILYDAIPIGKLFGDMDYQLINELNEEGGEGAGELALSGDQVVSGYLAGVNSEKFFTATNRFGKEATFYKTGDLVSVNENGNLVFHGRIDHQIKLNGFRIELNEIQLAITKVSGRKNVVIKKKSQANTHYLSAFIEGEALNIEKIKQQLETVLPSYMSPAEISFLPELPLTENGKINVIYLQNL